jgi:Aminoglycoside-2''-adenylyltransferase
VPYVIDDLAREQLSALARVSQLLADARIDYWLFGGWGRDFYAGEISRAHGDVDLAVWLEDRMRIEELLYAEGWKHAPESDEDGGTGYELGAVRLELTFLVRDDEGRPCISFKAGPARWPDELGDEAGELHGVRVRLIAQRNA